MNLDFGILWIEDSFSPQEEEALRRRVQQAGFIARIETIPNGAGVEELARLHKLYHKFDLILLDYRLQDENGDELAPKVRSLFPWTTILFYSGSANETDLRLKIAGRNVEGVYCSSRERFIESAGSLIDQTAGSLDRLSGMRGLAMKVVAECDELMKAAVLSMAARDKTCADKIGELDTDVLKDIDETKKKYEAAVDLPGRIESRAVDSAKLFKHHRRLTQAVAATPAPFGLDGSQVERLRELRNQSAQYGENVLRKRNILGHVVESQGDDGWVLTGSDEISVNDFAEIRRTFAVHIDAFRSMLEIVTILDGQETN